MKSTEAVVLSLVAQIAPDAVGPVTPKSKFVDDLGYDSLAVVELLLAIEQELALDPIELHEVSELETVGELGDWLQGRLSLDRTSQ